MRYEIILTNYLHLNISQSQIFHSEAALLTARRFLLKKTKSYDLVFFWSEWRESNSRPLEPHSSALPNWATPGYRKYNNTLCFIIQVFFLKKQNFINFSAAAIYLPRNIYISISLTRPAYCFRRGWQRRSTVPV